jgi:hypothetical protein
MLAKVSIIFLLIWPNPLGYMGCLAYVDVVVYSKSYRLEYTTTTPFGVED